MTTPDLAEWLLERISEDEDRAERTHAYIYGMAIDCPCGDRGTLGDSKSEVPYRSVRAFSFNVNHVAPFRIHTVKGEVALAIEATWPHGEKADRLLAECSAKRAIIAEHASDGGDCTVCAYEEACDEDSDGNRFWSRPAMAYPCRTLRLLAAPYATHPDFPLWAIDGEAPQ